MTPGEHIKRAEQLLAKAEDHQRSGMQFLTTSTVATAIAHALIALAVEGGVPHSTPVVQGG